MKLPRRGILKGLLASPVAAASIGPAPNPPRPPLPFDLTPGYGPGQASGYGLESASTQSTIERLYLRHHRQAAALQTLKLRREYGLTPPSTNAYDIPPEHSIYRSFKSIAAWKRKDMYDNNNRRLIEMRMQEELLNLEKLLDLPEQIVDTIMSNEIY